MNIIIFLDDKMSTNERIAINIGKLIYNLFYVIYQVNKSESDK